jgi:hypothetical protein
MAICRPVTTGKGNNCSFSSQRMKYRHVEVGVEYRVTLRLYSVKSERKH